MRKLLGVGCVLFCLGASVRVHAEYIPTVEECPKGVWVFLNFNKQAEELEDVQALAGKDCVRDFEYYEDFAAYFATTQEEKPTTLVVSGHSTGSTMAIKAHPDPARRTARWVDAEEIAGAMSEDQSSQVKTLYALGCYTGFSENVSYWSIAFPHLTYYAGFDGKGPSPSGEFLRRAEEARVAIDKGNAKAAEQAVMHTDTWGTIAQISVDANGKRSIDRVKKDASWSKAIHETLSAEQTPIEECQADLSRLREKTGAKNMYDLVGPFRPKCSEDGLTIEKDLNSPESLWLRTELYEPFLHLPNCPKEFYASREFSDFILTPDLVAKKYTANRGIYLWERDGLIALVKAPTISENYRNCTLPLFKALATRLAACPEYKSVAAAADALSKSAKYNVRRSILEIINRLDPNGCQRVASKKAAADLNDAERVAAALHEMFKNYLVEPPTDGLDFPHEVWDPIRADSPACARVAEAQDKLIAYLNEPSANPCEFKLPLPNVTLTLAEPSHLVAVREDRLRATRQAALQKEEDERRARLKAKPN